MTTSDYVLDIALILIVFRQLREERLTMRTVLLPLAIVGWAASHYLHNIPTAGNDVLLVAVFTAIGVTFGVFGGLATRVRAHGGNVYVKATAVAAALWVTSMSLRMAFAIWSSHHSGAVAIGHFSAAHDITSAQAWVTALIFMAFGEVLVRLGIIVVRGQLVATRHGGTVLAKATPRHDLFA